MSIAESPLAEHPVGVKSVFWNLGDAYPKRSGVVDVQHLHHTAFGAVQARTEGAIP